MTDLPAPTAQGDLAKTPFGHALLYCHQRELTGTLVIWPEGADARGQDRIYFDRGTPVSARLIERASMLDRGLLPLFARTSGAYAFYADIDLVGRGELVKTGRVDPFRVLAASLRGPSRSDVIRSVLDGFGDKPVRIRRGVEFSRFELLPKEQAFLDVVRAEPASIPALVPLCELGETYGERLLYLLAITKSIEPWTAGDAAPKPAAAPAAPSKVAPSSPTATASASAMSAAVAGTSSAGPSVPAPSGAPVPSVTPPSASSAASSPVDPSALPIPEFDDLPLPPEPDPKPKAPRPLLSPDLPPPPPDGLSPEHVTLWRDVAACVLALDTQNYFEMLDVPRDAGVDAVRKSYLALVKRWHPDRVPKELPTLKPYVERIFHHYTEAQKTLSDEKLRGRYLATVQEGGGTPEADRKVAAIVQAAMDQEKAEVLIRRRDLDGAIALLEGAIELSPDDGSTYATLAWALYLRHPGTDHVFEMLAAVDRAVALSPNNDRAHYYRGMILRRASRDAEALAALERAAELNPKNVDAMREVRIARMRGEKTPSSPKIPAAAPAKEGGGLFSKLFGGKKS